MWRAEGGIDHQLGDQVPQVNAPVEAVAKSSEVGAGVFCIVQRVISPGQAGFEIAQHGVDPLELRQVARLAAAGDMGGMGAAGLRHGAEAGQAVRQHFASGREMLERPVLDRRGGEPLDGRELDEQGAALRVHRHRRNEGDFVLRAASDLAPGALAAQVGVVKLDEAAQRVALLALGHRVHQFVMEHPGGRIAHAELTMQRQAGQTRLGLAAQVDRQEPGRQGQLGALKQAACSQRGLMAADAALIQQVLSAAHRAVVSAGADRAMKAVGPSHLCHRLGTLRLGAKTALKFRQRHAVLKLDSVDRHDLISVMDSNQLTPLEIHQMSFQGMAEPSC